MSRFKDKIQNAFSTSSRKWFSRTKTTTIRDRAEEDRAENKFDAADKFRVRNERSLEKLQWQKQDECNGKFYIELVLYFLL